MNAMLSNAGHLADSADAEFGRAVESFASELELSIAAEAAFGVWSGSWGNASSMQSAVDHALAAAAFVEGYLQAARDFGRLPNGDTP
jgi:hypothetical protein